MRPKSSLSKSLLKPAEQRKRDVESPSYEVYRSLVENSLDAMLLTDPSGEGRVLAANPEACRILGWPEEELIGSPRAATFNMDDPRTELMIAERRKSGRFRGELTFRRQDGSIFPAEVSTMLFEDSSGRTRAVMNIHDISERRNAEEELEKARMELEERVLLRTAELREANENLKRENGERRKAEEELYRREQEFRALVENTPDLVMRLDRNLRFTYVNHETDLILGKTRKESLGKTNREMGVPGQLADRIEKAERAAFETGREQSIEFQFSSPQGPQYIWARIVPEFGRDGAVASILVTARDITARMLAEEERRLLAVALEQADEGVVIGAMGTVRGTIIYSNPAQSAITGYGRDEIEGTNGDVLWEGSDDDRALIPVVRETILSGRPWSGRLTRRRKDGSTYLCDVMISPIRDDSGSVTHFVGLLHDVTREARIEEQFRQAQKMEAIGTLAGGVAHDFNNILAVIMGNTEIALDEIPEDGPRRNLEQIIKASMRARDLVKQILTFSRRTEQPTTAVHLSGLIRETFGMLRASLPTTVSADLDLGADPDVAYADASQVQQILMNLVNNAGRAMADGGHLDVSLTRADIVSPDLLPESDMVPGQYLVLTVKDTGHGMDATTVKRVFEPFFTTRENGLGMGLGLSVVYGMVKSHGGGVAVASSPGKGSEFRVYFQAAEPEAVQEEGTAALPGGEESILYVDDEPGLARLGESLLSRLGYSVVATTSSKDALELFGEDPCRFDLVITDQIMPEMTGATLAENLLRMRPDLPIILITGHSETMSRKQAERIGIRDFVLKPLSTKELAKVIRSALDHRD